MRIPLAVIVALAAQLLLGVMPVAAQIPGRNGLIYFTTPDQVDSTPECAVATVTDSGHGYNCIDTGSGFDAAVSPNRRLIAESVEVGDSDQIFAETLDGRHARQLTHPTEGQNLHPRFSPSGRQILFYKRFLGTDGIYVMNSDGSGQRRLTSDGGDDAVFAPNGRQIAYEGAVGSSGGLAIAGADASAPRLLAPDSAADSGPIGNPTTVKVNNTQPDFSPDGRRIVFTRLVTVDDGNGIRTTESHLYVVNIDGSNLHRLTSDPATVQANPSWSPDGRRIAYYRQPLHGWAGNGEVRVMNAAGGGDQEVAHGQYPTFSTVQGPVPAEPRVRFTVVKLNSNRSCFDMFNDGFGAFVISTATKQTGFNISFYIDRSLNNQATDDRSGNTNPNAVRRGHHRLRVVVSDPAVHDTVTRTVGFQAC